MMLQFMDSGLNLSGELLGLSSQYGRFFTVSSSNLSMTVCFLISGGSFLLMFSGFFMGIFQIGFMFDNLVIESL